MGRVTKFLKHQAPSSSSEKTTAIDFDPATLKTDRELAQVVRAWSKLPPQVKSAILTLVGAKR